MYLHHLVTIALVGLSYTWGYVRIGACVLLLHDSSDIVIDLLKTSARAAQPSPGASPYPSP